MYRVICLLLLTAEICNTRKGGLGGSRGSSGARLGSRPQTHGRSSSGGYHPQQGGYYPQHGGYRPQQGGYYPQHGGYNSQQNHHFSQGVGYQPTRFNPSKTKWSSGRGTFGTALLGGALGAAGGLATYELGKAILRSSSEPLRAPNGQSYYFDERNHQSKNGYFMCSIPIDDVIKTLQESSTPLPATNGTTNSTTMSPEQFFKTVEFNDGSRPKSLTWNCKTGIETCCGTDCCPVQQRLFTGKTADRKPSWIILMNGLVLLIRFCY